MSKIFILLTLITLSLSTKLKTSCVGLGHDCDWSAYCCGDMVCKNHRCVFPDAEIEEKDYQSNGGTMCSITHPCNESYVCQSHQCVLESEFIDMERKAEAFVAAINKEQSKNEKARRKQLLGEFAEEDPEMTLIRKLKIILNDEKNLLHQQEKKPLKTLRQTITE